MNPAFLEGIGSIHSPPSPFVMSVTEFIIDSEVIVGCSNSPIASKVFIDGFETEFNSC